jgi:hypothetical protein
MRGKREIRVICSFATLPFVVRSIAFQTVKILNLYGIRNCENLDFRINSQKNQLYETESFSMR